MVKAMRRGGCGRLGGVGGGRVAEMTTGFVGGCYTYQTVVGFGGDEDEDGDEDGSAGRMR